jgi:hypothetical protein
LEIERHVFVRFSEGDSDSRQALAKGECVVFDRVLVGGSPYSRVIGGSLLRRNNLWVRQRYRFASVKQINLYKIDVGFSRLCTLLQIGLATFARDFV